MKNTVDSWKRALENMEDVTHEDVIHILIDWERAERELRNKGDNLSYLLAQCTSIKRRDAIKKAIYDWDLIQ